MASEAGSEPGTTRSTAQRTTASAFWWRLTDNAFRRAAWLLVPIVGFAMLGLLQASKTLELYHTTGVLSASSNPLVPDQPIGGVAQQYWETPAAAASRTINEQLRTDAFVESVAERAGLDDAIESGVLQLESIRNSVWSSADGTSLVKVDATWGDPQTTFGLVEGTIAAYQEFLAESVASQSSEAEAFYTAQLADYQVDVDAAQQDLDDFIAAVSELDDDEQATVAVDLQLTRLTDALNAARAKAGSTQEQIDSAKLAVTQSRSEAGRSLTIIDEPKVPTAPQSTLTKRALTLVSFTLLGVIIVAGLLLIATVLDQSVASTSDLRRFDGVELVAVVPVLRLAQRTAGHRRRKRQRAPGPETAEEPQKVGV
ncbi:MAG: hypothetical protein QNJ12_18730 [Ilumatobacter sp.]|uniref:hypothetical protein n=1 Tax=Ilumatobacter sp. TaxID=1967498 RepID=UPI002624DD88|nr:hypothetical protein [Ilumatobacter sp.]MDJ0770836.1 hypothetical protein [Ilumatobacter sp.]